MHKINGIIINIYIYIYIYIYIDKHVNTIYKLIDRK